jgi:hypothetical protein
VILEEYAAAVARWMSVCVTFRGFDVEATVAAEHERERRCSQRVYPHIYLSIVKVETTNY